MNIFSFNPHSKPLVLGFLLPILGIRKLRKRRVKRLVWNFLIHWFLAELWAFYLPDLQFLRPDHTPCVPHSSFPVRSIPAKGLQEVDVGTQETGKVYHPRSTDHAPHSPSAHPSGDSWRVAYISLPFSRADSQTNLLMAARVSDLSKCQSQYVALLLRTPYL